MKILTVIGARPQFIKAAVLGRELNKDAAFQEVIVHTGQHYDDNMSEIFFKELEIPKPKYNLEVNTLSNSQMTAQMMLKLDRVLKSEKPDLVLVYGDTNSTLAGAITAKQNHFRVAHIEAGMRSFNMMMPEEVNRVITDRISDVLFCSTETAVNNLVKEGFENLNCEIFLSGDVMYDATLHYAKKSESDSKIISTLNLSEYILVTVHRAENVDNDEALSEIVAALNEISKRIQIVFPLHPRTKRRLEETGLKLSFDTINPVGYLDMIQLLKNCRIVLTDSGGIQKEAFFFKKNCITLRNETEWAELVTDGFNILTGPAKDKIIKAFDNMYDKNFVFKLPLYGNGKAGKKIVDFLRTAQL
jgi:UDP-GlcNAc3NAcA epimerase